MTSLQEEESIGALLGDVETASKVPARNRRTNIKPTVEKLAELLYNTGALPGELARLVDLLTLRNHLDQASLASLARNLYPLAKVDDETVLKIVSCLGHGQLKPTLPLQGLLLRWLVMVYHLLQNPSILSQVYGVLFNLLDTAAVRPQICHLLALITRRKHVKPFRIQAILRLFRQTANDPNLVGLLRVFKNYYPEIIVGDVTKGRAATFKHPDLAWRERLDEIRQQQAERHAAGVQGGSGFTVNHPLGRSVQRAVVPAVHTLHAQENSVTLEEIDSADRLAENLEKIEMPTQIVAVMADPLLQKLMVLRPDAEGFARVSNWIAAYMTDVATGDADPSVLLDMVDVIHSYVLNTKTLSPLLLSFFRELFKTWNGRDKREIVLECLSYAPMKDFKELRESLLDSLQSSVLDNTAESQLALLKFYTRLLRRWAITMQSNEDLSTLPVEAVPELINHVNILALTVTQTSPTVTMLMAVLDFYAVNTDIFSKRQLLKKIEVTIPHPLVVYILHFSHSLGVVSRLGGILARYKQAWGALLQGADRPFTKKEREQAMVFNGLIMDICNCTWRGLAFSTADKNSMGCRVPKVVTSALERYLRGLDSDFALESIFGLSHSPTLCLQSISYVRKLEDAALEQAESSGDEQQLLRARHPGPVTQRSLSQLAARGGLQLSWQDYRLGVLKHLEAEGFGGIPDLMYNTMKTLMKDRRQ